MPSTVSLNPSIKTIGILSDSHGFLDSRILNALKNVDVILHAGDIMDKSVMEQLLAINANVYFVTGNNDVEAVWPKKHASVVKAIPESIVFTIGLDKIGIIHGHQFGKQKPDHNRIREHFAECRMAIYGHTHHQTIDTLAQPWVINPGASGNVRTHGGVSCLLLSLKKDHWDVQTIKYKDQKIAA